MTFSYRVCDVADAQSSAAISLSVAGVGTTYFYPSSSGTSQISVDIGELNPEIDVLSITFSTTSTDGVCIDQAIFDDTVLWNNLLWLDKPCTESPCYSSLTIPYHKVVFMYRVCDYSQSASGNPISLSFSTTPSVSLPTSAIGYTFVGYVNSGQESAEWFILKAGGTDGVCIDLLIYAETKVLLQSQPTWFDDPCSDNYDGYSCQVSRTYELVTVNATKGNGNGNGSNSLQDLYVGLLIAGVIIVVILFCCFCGPSTPYTPAKSTTSNAGVVAAFFDW